MYIYFFHFYDKSVCNYFFSVKKISVCLIYFFIETDEYSLSVLCYADDIVIITENEDNMQIVLDNIAVWFKKGRKKVNTKNEGYACTQETM